jgi:ribosomal-protein-alanine N-acetyltransferase
MTRATTADLDALLALEECFDPASRWSADAWLAELSSPDRLVLASRPVEPGTAPRPVEVVETSLIEASPTDQPARVDAVATFQVVAEVADLHRIVVAPQARGRGLATALVEAGCAWSVAQGAERMLLEVEHDNAPALALYRRLGFVELHARRDYYGPGRTALVMQKRLEVGL